MIKAIRRGVAAAALAYSLVAGGGIALAQQNPPEAATDALAALNDSFRSAYREARAWRISRIDRIIVVQFDELHLVRGGQTRTERFTPPIYHEYKAIAHIPLALYVRLAPLPGRSLDKATLDWLTMYRKQIEAAGASLEGLPGWTAEQLRVHRAIVAASAGFIGKVGGAGQVSGDELAAYTRAMRPLVLASAEAAAKAQLDGLHALVNRWRAEMGPGVWSRIAVVVLGPKQPRPGNLQFEYFTRAMGRAAVGTRLWYAEGIFDKDGGVNLVGTILLDRGASIAFFGSAVRLERDLLSDAAQRHLDRLFPPRR